MRVFNSHSIAEQKRCPPASHDSRSQHTRAFQYRLVHSIGKIVLMTINLVRVTSLILFILGFMWAFFLIKIALISPNLFVLSGYLIWIGWFLRYLNVSFIVKHTAIFWSLSAIQNFYFPLTSTMIGGEGFVPLDIWWITVGTISVVFACKDRTCIKDTVEPDGSDAQVS